MNFIIGIIVAVIAFLVVDSCSVDFTINSRTDTISYNRGVGFDHKTNDGQQYFQNPR